MEYDIIVVGLGHSGVEAAASSSTMGKKVLGITSSLDNIATLPCNPSIGGSAKGIVVREIDALGGIMGKLADRNIIQMKMLNSSKGPGVRSLRAQVDKVTYPKMVREYLENLENLDFLEATVEDLIVDNNECKGVILEDGTKIYAKRVILTTGTYLKPDIMVGNERKRIGPNGQKPSLKLSDKLREYGFDILRLKTGTPARIKKDSINYDLMQEEQGDNEIHTFSFDNISYYDIESQDPCYLTYTTERTHEIINNNLNKSSMYGAITDLESVGPRYCPSIEDKIVRFKDKLRHQLFMEPESRFYDDIYVQGFSTSMPHDIQLEMLKSVIGLENVEVIKYAYAIEYDAINPIHLNKSLETKGLKNLFTAGQINGTSGYEEAAGQGLVAGINATYSIDGKDPLILSRDEAYIGVLIDDLVNKGVTDPYRLLTSRAEYRLLLRHDNADIRLKSYGHDAGLVNEKDYGDFCEKLRLIEEVIELLKNTYITGTLVVNDYLESINSSKLTSKISLYELLKRTEIEIDNIKHFIDLDYSDEVLFQVSVSSKYEGYIKKAKNQAENMKKYEEIVIPSNIDYNSIQNLASEAIVKLNAVRPLNIGQASRISGVNPSDIAILTVYLRKEYYGKKYF